MSTELGSEWYRDPGSFLDKESANRMTKGDDYAQVQDRGSGTPPYPILRFRLGITFMERIPFSGLQRVIEWNYASGALRDLFVPPHGGMRLDPERVAASLEKLGTTRNDVAHHRAITPEAFQLAKARASEFLEHLEFDTDRALGRIYSAVEAARQ
jgi:hypothetical protein